MSEISTYLKVGTDGDRAEHGRGRFHRARSSVDGPVGAFRVVRATSAAETIRLRTGAASTAVDPAARISGDGAQVLPGPEAEPWVREVLARWETTLDPLSRRTRCSSPRARLGHQRQLIENYMAKHDLGGTIARADDRSAVHDIRPGRGLYYKLEESDAVDRIATDDESRSDLRPAKERARTSAACAWQR